MTGSSPSDMCRRPWRIHFAFSGPIRSFPTASSSIDAVPLVVLEHNLAAVVRLGVVAALERALRQAVRLILVLEAAHRYGFIPLVACEPAAGRGRESPPRSGRGYPESRRSA